ncbi:exosome complex exonuclease RRP42 [Planococcus citri]|uniref:exosome complex exonuclease RRP42 n=1 Tax=Planococcus citri TaxID=170843 RepID=UPI0031F89618
MYPVFLSDAERTFIWDGVEVNLRCDGRKRSDYRPMELETDVVTHANGSARLRLANTDILVGVKTEIDVPLAESPNMGKIEFFVDCSANATPAFEGRGGEDLANEICSTLLKSYNILPLEELCIVPEFSCWKLYVDILILECGGNLYDAVSLAVKAALHNLRIPRVTGKYIDGANVDLQLSDDLFDCWKIDVSKAPCLVTLCKIGEFLIVDPTVEEEACSSGSIVVSVTEKGLLTGIVKIGEGSFHQKAICEAVKLACSIGIKLNETIGSSLKLEEDLASHKDRCGFLK